MSTKPSGSPPPRSQAQAQRRGTDTTTNNMLTVTQDPTARRFSTGNIEAPSAKPQPLTLLEQTEMFRKKYSKKWRKQQQQRQQRTELLGRPKAGSFITRYNEKVANERRESLQVEQLRKLEVGIF